VIVWNVPFQENQKFPRFSADASRLVQEEGIQIVQSPLSQGIGSRFYAIEKN